MIILHNQHDKDSRDFVEKYGEGNTVIEYPECVEQYIYISAFPSVVIDVPAYYQPEQTTIVTGGSGGTGGCADCPDSTSIVGDTTSVIIEAEYNVKDHQEIRRFSDDPCDIDAFWKDIQDYIAMVKERATNNPPKDGVEYKE